MVVLLDFNNFLWKNLWKNGSKHVQQCGWFIVFCYKRTVKVAMFFSSMVAGRLENFPFFFFASRVARFFQPKKNEQKQKEKSAFAALETFQNFFIPVELETRANIFYKWAAHIMQSKLCKKVVVKKNLSVSVEKIVKKLSV